VGLYEVEVEFGRQHTEAIALCVKPLDSEGNNGELGVPFNVSLGPSHHLSIVKDVFFGPSPMYIYIPW